MKESSSTLYKTPWFPLPPMLWSGDFVAKGEKGDCVTLQEEGTSVYTHFTLSSGFRVAGSSLVVFWAAVLFLTIVAKVMLWSGDFVAKGEKGDCVALQEEGTSVYTRFTPYSGFVVARSSLVVLWAAVLFLAIVSKVSLYHSHVFCLMLRL